MFLFNLYAVVAKQNTSNIYTGAVGMRTDANFENHHGDAVDPKAAYEW